MIRDITPGNLIWICPTAGGTRVRLDGDTTDQHGPSWSPDGNRIAYRRLKNGSWEIVKTPVGGGAIMRLDDAAPGAFRFSRDGSRLFAAQRGVHSRWELTTWSVNNTPEGGRGAAGAGRVG